MQKPASPQARTTATGNRANDESSRDFCASVLELDPAREPPLILGRRSAAAMVADILLASDDMRS
jgi:hypothetical protein